MYCTTSYKLQLHHVNHKFYNSKLLFLYLTRFISHTFYLQDYQNIPIVYKKSLPNFCDLHMQKLKFCRKTEKFGWQSQRKLSSAKPVKPAFYKSAHLLWTSWIKCLCWTLRSWVHPSSMLFRTFSPGLEDIDTFQCSSDCFPHWPHISGCFQNCQNYILMYHCSPIAGKRFWKGTYLWDRFGTDFRTFSPQLENNDTLFEN